jgi:hypothetical protein
MDTMIPQSLAKPIWVIFTILSILVAGWQTTAIVLWGQDSKYAAVAAIWVGVIAAVLRFLTTNSMNPTAKAVIFFLILGFSSQFIACSAAPVRREVCTAFVSCENALDPQNPIYLNTYGDTSACWTDHRQGMACVEACEAGIASLKAAGISCPVVTPLKEVK